MKMTFNLPDDLHRKLKIEAAKRGVTIADVIRDQIRMWLAQAKPRT